MSPNSNKENISLGPFSPSFKHPSKSILRDNTLPILNDKRRVSFAPEVTLHKFDFIPSSATGTSKRRKTISGSIPSSQEFDSPVKTIGDDIHVNGLEVLEDSSDESSLDSVDNFEESPQKASPAHDSGSTITGITFTEDGGGAGEDQEEETMELTGQIQNINSQIQETLASLVSTSVATSTTADEVEFPSDDESDDGDNIDMELTGPQAFASIQQRPQSEEDVTMEVTMDVTEVYHKTIPAPVLDVIAEASEESSQDPTLNVQPVQPSETPIQSFSMNDIPLLAKQSTAHDEPIQTSTQVESQEGQTISAEFPIVEEEETEITMDVTKVSQHITNLKQSSENASNEIETTQPMELTQVSNVIQVVAEHESEGTQQMDLTRVPSNIQTKIEVVEDTHGSQPMELTQVDSMITSNVIVKTDEEIPALPHSPNSSLASVPETLISTTKIPLAEVSTIERSEIDENYEDVPLSNFLDDIGVKFYDDLDIDVNSLERLSISTTSDLNDNKLEDYIKALPKLDLISLYQFSCDELSNNIRDGREMYSEYSKTIEVNNPVLFKEYYASDDDDKSLMNVRLQLIKDHTRFQSRKTWYDWRTQLTKNLIIELDDKKDRLLQDQEKIKSDLEKLKSSFDQTQSIFVTTKQKLQTLRSIKGQLSHISAEELKLLKNELISSKTTLLQLKATTESHRQDLVTLNEKIMEVDESVRKLSLEVSADEKEITKNRKYEVNEIDLLKQKFSFVQKLSKLKYLGLEDSQLSCEFDHHIICKLNFKDITDHANIIYSSNSNPNKSVFHNKDLIDRYALKLTTINQGSTIIENFKNFKLYWKALKQFDSALYKLSLKFPISYMDSDNGIKFQVRYFSFDYNFKVFLDCYVAFKDLPNQNVKLHITAKLQRSNSERDENLMKNELINNLGNSLLFSNHALLNLSFT